MGKANPIPEKVVNYNVYDEGEKLVGISGEVTLPNLEAMAETISGAGILGEYQSITPGHFGSLTMDLVFRTLYDTSFKLMDPAGKTLTLRASQQSYDVSGGMDHRPLKIVLKVVPKGINLGKIAVGGSTDTTNTVEVLYIKITENGKVLLELDKLSFIFKLNGVDILAAVREQI